MSTDEIAQLAPRIDTLYAEQGLSPVREIVKLQGDASARRYFRVQAHDGSSRILMVMPAGAASVSEEISSIRTPSSELPFLQIHRTLQTCGIRVPQVIHYSAADQWILLEDLGDRLLARCVEGADPEQRWPWYERAIDLLCRVQRATAKLTPRDSLAMQRSFDDTLLNWEFDHFREYGWEARFGSISKRDTERFEELSRALTNEITALPYRFTHRDFQSRNILVTNDELALIDFQDALRGPYIYDLVALLRDSYIALTPEEVTAGVRAYAVAMQLDPAVVQRHFDLVTIQRKLKDAGRFVYIDLVKHNPNFLPYVAPSLHYVREAMVRTPSATGLFELLARHLPEWRP